YVLTVFVNGQRLGAPRDITVLAQHAICIPANLLDLIGLKDSAKQKVTLSEAGQCLDFSALTGVKSTVELSTLSLKITIP
ncbi:FimD/PapC N-terminal domain-containing protein, partial [Klebsiella pneumoniae]